MEFVIGGAYQGKKEYCKDTYQAKEEACFYCREEEPVSTLLNWISQNDKAGNRFIFDLHLWVRACQKENLDACALLQDKMDSILGDTIITMDEVGQGIVPIDRIDRDYREAVGQCGKLLAGEAKKVTRVFCGLPQAIKK